MRYFYLPKGRQACIAYLSQLHEGRYRVTVDEAKAQRSIEQNDKLHALLGDIAKQKQWDGEWLDVESWKRLLTAGWMRATGRRVKLVRAIDGTGFDVLYQRTSKLSVSEMNELIEYVTAWAVDAGIRFYSGGFSSDDADEV